MVDKTNNLGGKRQEKTRVKTARGRKPSSTKWLQRQLNDPYVSLAKKEGYRSRAAYKIIEIDDKFSLFKPGKRVVDLGCAPGGWSQVAAARTKSSADNKLVVGMDLLEVPSIAGVTLFTHDFSADDAPQILKDALAGHKVDVVLSDIAPNTTGHGATDHMRIMALLGMAVDFACEVLVPGGTFVGKVFQGGAEQDVLTTMKKHFAGVKHFKPKASRSDSAEMYVVATGFRK
ncbi:MAG: RlmE family RNA methyltransferase [Alphaproteobacteria bacterium]|nr:RlmE family RNA methyltransferase [Alphaproteobacteria bacterium]